MDQDVTSICTVAVLITNDSMDEATAYELTKALIDNLSEFQSAHAQLAKVTLADIAEGSYAPRHPGALRALREAGLID